MNNEAVLDFFLGAISPSGFTGWFAETVSERGATAYLIKAGPGCGKSTLMRTLFEHRAAAEGVRAGERIHCSSDPKSLDGVYLPRVGAWVVDATAPHTLDCKFPGAAERVVSLYDALDNDFLYANREEILDLGRQNAFYLQHAAAHYALACALLSRRRSMAGQVMDTEKVDRFTMRLAARTMPRQRGVKNGEQRHRLLSAPTPGAVSVWYSTVTKLATKALYVIQDSYGAVSARMLERLALYAKANGYDAILCHCPTDQNGKLDHLFIPALGLGFVTSCSWHPMNFSGQRTIHASRFMDLQALKPDQPVLRSQKRLASDLIRKTCTAQSRALQLHDELEKYYIQATDFTAVNAIREALEEQFRKK